MNRNLCILVFDPWRRIGIYVMLTECQICLESFQSNQIDKVSCGSSVDHYVCFDCEKTWRSKMIPKNGVRIMNCPTCRQPEKYRTVESLQREATGIAQVNAHPLPSVAVARAAAPYVPRPTPISTLTREEIAAINARLMAPTSRDAPIVLEVRPPRARCASGRDCHSTSQTGRSMTHLKCANCHIVFCCRSCFVCIGCNPYVPLD